MNVDHAVRSLVTVPTDVKEIRTGWTVSSANNMDVQWKARGRILCGF